MSYFGGKAGAGTYQKIINLIPPHEIYIEPFAGGGAIYEHKRPAKKSFLVDLDPAAVQILTAIQYCNTLVMNRDGIDYLKHFEYHGGEFVYCDPPYLWSTRKSNHKYQHELTTKDHWKLLGIIKELPCPVMISGYWSMLYDSELSDWNHASFQVTTRGATLAMEHLWYNYPTPKILHDYSYIGEDFTERQRIKRKIRRWVNRLRNLPPLERAAILNSIAHSQK